MACLPNRRSRHVAAGLVDRWLGLRLLVIDQNVCNSLPAPTSVNRVGGRHRGRDNERFPQGPSSATSPGVWVEIEFFSKNDSGVCSQECPSDGEITCGIADRELTEVDDRAQSTASNKEIAWGKVAMHPDGCSVPGSPDS